MGSFGEAVAPPSRPSSAPASTAGDDGRRLLLLWAAGMLWILVLVWRKVDATPANGLVFNEMLVRLLHGRFDVPPSVIGAEGIAYHGRTYAYFGIFCALLRLPLLLTGQIAVDVTKESMVIAAAVSLGARLAALNLALDRAQGLSRTLRLIILGAVAVGGESLQYLRPSLFQECCSWGDALASVFVLLAVRRIFGPAGRSGGLYAGMALAAGLALLCRVSFGFGLYAALSLMLCVEAWRSRARWTSLRSLAPAALILAVLGAAAAGVNVARWDDPLKFVPLRYQMLETLHADRLARLERYGAINIRRAPLGLAYYFAPIWVLPDGRGGLLFQQAQVDLFDSIELPPSSFFISDPTICVLPALGPLALARRRQRIPHRALVAGALFGLACPAALMLVVISLTFRYRMDFYPALDFAACVGAAALRLDPARQPVRRFAYAGATGALVSTIGLWLYCCAPFGPALDFDMRGGWTTPMVDVARGRSPYIGHLMPDGRRVDVPSARG